MFISKYLVSQERLKYLLTLMSIFLFLLAQSQCPEDVQNILEEQLYNFEKNYIWKKDFEKALEILDEVDEQAKQFGCNEIIFNSHGNRLATASFHGEIEMLYDELLRFEKNVEIYRKVSTEADFALYYNWGRYYHQVGGYMEAVGWFEKAKRTQQDEGFSTRFDSIRYSIALLNIGVALIRNQQNNEAIPYLEQSSSIEGKLNNDSDQALVLKHIGKAYANLENYIEAYKYYHRAYLIQNRLYNNADTSKKVNYKNRLIITLNELGTLQAKEGRFKEAFQKFKQSLKYHYPKDEIYQSTYLSYGHALLMGKYYNQAIAQFQNSIKVHKSKTVAASAVLGLAQVAYELRNFNDALKHIQTAFAFSINKNLPAKSLLSVPNYEKATSKRQFLEILELQAKIMTEKYREEPLDLSYLELIQEISRKGLELVDIQRRSYSIEDDKYNLTERAYPLIEMAIEATLNLYSQRKDDQYLENILRLMEKGKAVVLRDVFNRTNAASYGITERIAQREKQLRFRTTQIENKLLTEREKQRPDPNIINNLTAELTDAQNKYGTFLNELKDSSKDYYELKYGSNLPPLSEISGTLESDQAIVEYFVGDENSFVAIVYPNGQIHVEKLSVNMMSLEKIVSQYRKNIILVDDKIGQKNWCNSSSDLYQFVISPIKSRLPKRLLIIPDGPLCNIPFSTLLVPGHCDSEIDFGTLPYLLNKHSFSYNYSLWLSVTPEVEKNILERLVIFAPSFSDLLAHSGSSNKLESNARNTLSKLSPIKYNIPEAHYLDSLFNTENNLYVDNSATKDNFLTAAQNADILHIHTHGILNSSNPSFSYIALFSKDPDKDKGRVYVKDLYELEIRALMVSLPACDSGVGELSRGEGLISLARGFAYAGAKSIFTTFWSVNQGSTTDMVRSFFTRLKIKYTKDTALEKSQLQYIEANKNSELAHPYFWGAYIIIGNEKGIYEQNSMGRNILIPILSFLMILIVWFYYNRNK